MGRRLAAMTAPLRLALAVLVGTAMALLVPSLLTSAADGSSVVVLAGLAIAVAARRWCSSRPATVAAPGQPPRPAPEDRASSSLAGWVTDPLHHPLRPRAPGQA